MEQNAKRMLRRNGLRMLLRTPGKTLLFGFLIFVLATVLMICATLAASSSALLLRRDADYITTALLQADDDAEDASAALDETALASEPSVLGFQKAQLLSLWPVDYQRQIGLKETCFGVVAVKLNSISQKDPRAWNATVTKVLYSPFLTAGQSVELNFASLNDLSYAESEREGQQITPENCAAYGYYYVTEEYSGYDMFGSAGEPTKYYFFIRGTQPAEGDVLLAAVFGDRARDMPCLFVTEYGDRISGALDVTQTGPDRNAPQQKPYFDFAEKWRRMTSRVDAVVSEDPRYLEEFTQGDYCVIAGDFYAPGETERCLLPESLAGRLNLSVGDPLCFEVLPRLGIYEPEADGDLPQKTYTVEGILSVTADAAQEHAPYVYLSDAEGLEDRFYLADETVGTLRLKNGASAEALERIEALLPDGVRMTVFDQGWEAVSKSLTALLHGSLRLLLAASPAALALLALFAYLFVGRQSETLQTMWMLGTPKKAVRRFALRSAGTVLGSAALLSCIVTAALSGALNAYVTSLLSDPAMMYSNASLGVAKTPERAVLPSYPALLLCALCLIACGLVLCQLFCRFAIERGRPQAGKARSCTKKEETASLLRGAGIKFLSLSIRRRKGRSLSVVAVSLLLPLFLALIATGIDAARQQLSTLTENTHIVGYLTDYSGKKRSGLFLERSNLEALERIDALEHISYAQADAASVLFEDGTPEFTDTLVYTNDILCWKEFDDRAAYEITWLAGFDESVFASRRSFTQGKQAWMESDTAKAYRLGEKDDDPRKLWVVMPAEFLTANGLQLGDTVRLSTQDARGGGFPVDAVDDYQIVGSLKRRDGQSAAHAVFYTSLENYDKYKEQLEPAPNGETYSVWYLWVREGYDCCRFELSDTARLQEVKSSMKSAGISQVRRASRYRIYPVFDDRLYLDESAKIQNAVASYTWLLWIAGGLCFGAGIALSLLMLAKRQTEAAILRTLGMRKGKTAAVFFAEQAVLCAAGTGAAMLLRFLWGADTDNAVQQLTLFVFFAGCLIGAAGFCLAGRRKHLLTLLSETE